METIRITTLVDNSAGPGFLAEWGLSLLVEAKGLRVLLDCGAGLAAVYNAQLLGLDLGSIDYLVLSHGHYDHTGGLREVLRRVGREIAVVAHPEVWAPKYSRLGQQAVEAGEGVKYIGIPFARAELESLGGGFMLRREPVHLGEGFLTSGEIPSVTSYERIDDYLLVREGGVFLPDPLADDLALILDTDFGLVVVLGCGHRGMINTLRHARTLTGRERVYAVIGGTHLLHASPERLDRTAAELRQMGVQKLAVSHCTGFRSAAYLARVFGEGFTLNQTGARLTFP
ncbi:MAG: MBL fold metallo-hydrolase [Clostridia bacterium]|jgi:7,8-dihydropterin-6-yl-methyl-4-(beta-D-ribofuranosyl)aminobenzene 5'-phosphate synthase|nr:MBL fold metallo-hydrolase [Clostridia bacterium]MDH7572866.1 MBL fold metallo-hydrolase [Clostridia bacterium]